MPKWLVKQKFFGHIANLVKSGNGCVLSDHEYEKSEHYRLVFFSAACKPGHKCTSVKFSKSKV